MVPEDPDTQEVLQKIRSIPNKEDRVIGVMNKCDRRQDCADYWVSILNDCLQLNSSDSSRSWTQSRMSDVQATDCT